jgi:hypothetical protein
VRIGDLLRRETGTWIELTEACWADEYDELDRRARVTTEPEPSTRTWSRGHEVHAETAYVRWNRHGHKQTTCRLCAAERRRKGREDA